MKMFRSTLDYLALYHLSTIATAILGQCQGHMTSLNISPTWSAYPGWLKYTNKKYTGYLGIAVLPALLTDILNDLLY